MDQTSLAQVILSSMNDGVITLDQAGHITALNPAAEEILGLDRKEVVGSLYAEVFFASQANDDFNQILLDLVTTQEEKPYSEVPFLREDGDTRTLALTTSLLIEPQADKRLGAVMVFKDITSVHRLRSQRDELAGELAAKHEELKNACLNLEERNRTLHEAQRKVFWIKLGVVTLVVVLFAALTLML